MLYAVIDAQGEPIAQGLTLAEAGHAILTHDSAQYEIREEPDGVGYRLWRKTLQAPWIGYGYYSLAVAEADARAEILADVVRSADTANRWPAEAIPQADLDAMQEGGEG